MSFAFNGVKMVKTVFNYPGCFTLLFTVAMIIAVSYESNKIDKARIKFENQVKLCYTFDTRRCENGGLLKYDGDERGVVCECTSKYSGEKCEKAKPASLISMILTWIRNSDVTWGIPMNWWRIIPFTSGRQLATVYAFHQGVLKNLEDGFYSPGSEANEFNINERLLPRSRPLMCPNDKNLPPLNTLYTKIFERKSGQFKPDVKNRNLLFQAFYQYFILQFFDSDSNLTVTASQLYGNDAKSERSLRSFSGGKLKTLYFNNEHYAPYIFSPILDSNVYLKEFIELTSIPTFSFNRMWNSKTLSLSPMLYAISTFWVREHNRVCDMLSLMPRRPKWTDEEMYKTARKVVTGQMMTIMMNEILITHTGHAYPLELRPEVYHHRIQNISSSATPIELILMMAVSSLPEQFNSAPMSSTFFGNSKQVMEAGLKNTLQFMISQTMGRVTAHNDGFSTKPLTKFLLKLSREHAVQSFNNYRRRFGLPAYDSFFQLTKNWKTADELNNLYKSVDDVELLTGMLTEGSRMGSLPTSSIMTHSFIINAILTNKLTSELSWEPSTFGGDHFFNLVKFTTLRSFVCSNLVNDCDGLKISLYAR